jgi:hypothetical protein
MLSRLPFTGYIEAHEWIAHAQRRISPRSRQSVPIFLKRRLLCPLPKQWQGHLPPGQTHLNFLWLDAEQSEKVGVVPTGIEHFSSNATFFCFLLFE